MMWLPAVWMHYETFNFSSQPCLVSTPFLSPSLCISLAASIFRIFHHMNEPVQHGESRESVLRESLCLVHRDVIFTALSLLEYTDGLPSSSTIVCLFVCPSASVSVCLSVTQLAVHPCTPRYLWGFLMGIFKVVLHAVKWLNFSPSLSRVSPQLLQMHSGPAVIGNALTAWRWNNMFACFGVVIIFGLVVWTTLRLSLSPSLCRCHSFSCVAQSTSLAPTSRSVFPCVLPPACAMWRKVVLCSAHVGSIRDESTLQW